jgi:hypothetical protein
VGEDASKADAALIVALRNAYADGSLVPRERVEHALCVFEGEVVMTGRAKKAFANLRRAALAPFVEVGK